jgi:hypothetical protein
MFEAFGFDDSEEFPRLTDEEFAEMVNEPLPPEYAHLQPFGSDPDGFVVQAAATGPSEHTLSLLTAVPVTALTDTGRSLGLQSLERLSAHVEAVKSQFIAAIAGPPPASRRESLDDFSAAEVGVATGCTDDSAARKIGFARDLQVRLQATRLAMAGGRISHAQAIELSERTRHIRDLDIVREIEAGLLKFAHRQDLGRFRRSLSGWLARKDPQWAARAAKARRDVIVEHRANDNGTGELYVYGPLEHTHLMDLALSARAAQLKADVGGTVAERKFAVLRDWADAALTAPDAPTSHGMAVRIDVVSQESTLLGRDDQPVEIPGVGMLPASALRWALADGAEVRALLVDATTGFLKAIDPNVYRVPPQLADLLITRYVTSAAPHSNVRAAGCDMEHNIPHPAGRTDENNVTPLCRRWHRAKTHGDWTYLKDPVTGIVTWRSPTGLKIEIDPYDYRAGP